MPGIIRHAVITFNSEKEAAKFKVRINKQPTNASLKELQKKIVKDRITIIRE